MKRIMLCMSAAMLLLLAGCAQEAASVGIIGGADGPTVVFVAAAEGWWILPLAILAAIALAVVLLIRYIRKRRK